MNIEENIKDCITKQLEAGIIEKVLERKMEECISESVNDLFKWNGAVKKAMDAQLEAVLVPFLEGYDYSKCVAKLDEVMKEVLLKSFSDSNQLINNIGKLMEVESIKEIKLSEIFKKYQEYCASHIDQNEIDMDFEGGYINVDLEVEDVSSSWSSFERKIVRLTCEEDENLNIEFEIDRYKDSNESKWDMTYKAPCDIRSIRHMNEMDILLLKLSQIYKAIDKDINDESEEVFIEYEP